MAGNLSHFWQLASASTSDRLVSSSTLVSSLVEKQQSLGQPSSDVPERLFADNLGKNDDRTPLLVSERLAKEAETSLEAHNASDVVYSVKRLLKGLASHRESSRLGFAVTLSELLAQLSTVSASQIITLVLHFSHSPGRVKGQEERDLMFARLFGVFAIVRSGLLFRPGTSGLEDFIWMTDILETLSRGKEWFAESCAWVEVQLLVALAGADDVHWKNDAFQNIAQRLSSATESRPESLAVLLTLRHAAPSVAQTARLPGFKEQDPLAASNLAVLTRLLKNASSLEIAEDTGAKGGGNGYWNAQVHFVWDLILEEYVRENFTSLHKSRASFSEVYRIAVDESLFATSASPERKSWGFQVFEKVIVRVPVNQLASLFTPNFMRTWMNHLAGKDRLLHGAAHHAANAIKDVVKESPSCGFLVVAQLLGQNGNQNFDAVTKSKTVESILSVSNFDGVNQHIIRLLDVANEGHVDDAEKNDEEEELQSIDTRRKVVLDQVLALLKNASIPKSDETVDIVLTFLIVHGFFRIVKVPKDASPVLVKAADTTFSDKVKAACRNHFISCLNELVGQSTTILEGDFKGKKVRGASTSGELWLSRAYEIFESLRKSTKNYKLLKIAEESAEALLQRAREQLSAIRKSSHSSSEKRRAFESLLFAAYFVSLQNAREEEFEVVERLLDCGERLLLMGDKERQQKHPDEPAPVELLVDSLVGLLELPSAFLRRVAGQTFASFTDEMTRDSIALLVNQLGVGEGEDEDGDGSDRSEEMEEDEADSGGVASLSQTSATSSSSDEEDDERDNQEKDDDDEESQEVDPILRARVQEALQAGGIADSEASDEEDEEDVEDKDGSDVSDLDDDQMMLIDDKLAEIFRERLSSKREQEDAKREGLIFQNKILDLIEIFARQQKSSALCLGLVQPLFVLCLEKDPGFKQVSSKAESILLQILRGGRASNVDMTTVAPHLEKIHSMACHGEAPVSLCNAANLYLTRCCLLNANEDVFEVPPMDQGGSIIRDIYQSTIEDFTTRKASLLKPNFIIDACKRFPRLGWALRTKVVAACQPGAATQGYQQAQAFEMLQVILNGKDTREAELFKDRLSFMPIVAETLFTFLRDADSLDQTSIRVRDVIKCGIQFVRATQRAVNANSAKMSSEADEEAKRKAVGAIWKVTKIQEIAQKLDASDKFGKSTAIQGLLKQMQSLVDPSSSKKGSKAHKTADADASAGLQSAKKRDNSSVEVSKDSKSSAEESKPKKKKKKTTTTA